MKANGSLRVLSRVKRNHFSWSSAHALSQNGTLVDSIMLAIYFDFADMRVLNICSVFGKNELLSTRSLRFANADTKDASKRIHYFENNETVIKFFRLRGFCIIKQTAFFLNDR